MTYERAGAHTETEGKHIWQSSGSVIEDMKLAGLEKRVPERCGFAKCSTYAVGIVEKSQCIEESKNGTNCVPDEHSPLRYHQF